MKDREWPKQMMRLFYYAFLNSIFGLLFCPILILWSFYWLIFPLPEKHKHLKSWYIWTWLCELENIFYWIGLTGLPFFAGVKMRFKMLVGNYKNPDVNTDDV